MNREELKEILERIVNKMEDAPQTGCIFGDGGCDENTCDLTTFYAVGEEG